MQQKASCKKCKSKEHNAKFCTENPTLDPICSFCEKTSHTAENCRAHKKAEKKARSQESKSTGSNVSNPLTTATGQMQDCPTSALSLTRPQMQEQVPSQLVPPPMIGQRLQQLAMSADGVTTLLTLRGILPLAYPGREGMNQNQAYSMAGSTHSIPTLAPGMYDYTNVQGAQSTSSNSSLESHVSQLSRTILQLAQTNQVIANHQQQNHKAMVDVQKQQMDAFNALAAATEQRKYDNLFVAIPRYDGSNKEECAIWISRIDQLATSTGRNLQMELLNQADGPVMTMLAGMSEDVDDEDIKEKLMCCFSNAPTTIQAIQVLRSMQQKPGEQARLYAACYQVLHYRANQLMADEQTQNGEMMFFAGTLMPPLWKKLLKKMHSHYRPHTLREAFDLTLEFEKEYQITQPSLILKSWRHVMKISKKTTSSLQKKYR